MGRAGTDRHRRQPDKAARPKETDMRFLMYTLGDESVPIPPPTPELYA